MTRRYWALKAMLPPGIAGNTWWEYGRMYSPWEVRDPIIMKVTIQHMQYRIVEQLGEGVVSGIEWYWYPWRGQGP